MTLDDSGFLDHRHATPRIPHDRAAAGRGADAGAAARGPRLRRAVGRFSRQAAGGDRLRRVRLFARRLRQIEPGHAAAPAHLHARRGARRAAASARRHRLPARAAARPQRRRLDRRDLCRQPSGSPRRRPGADRAAFLHRGYRHRLDRRGAQGLRDRRPARRAWRAGMPTSTTPSRAGTAPGSIPNSANGISPSNSPISACRC